MVETIVGKKNGLTGLNEVFQAGTRGSAGAKEL
jgi:hypothetical protein